MKYIVRKEFFERGRIIKVGQVLNLSNDRAKVLAGKIEPYIEEAKLEDRSEKAVKRTRKKKVDEDRHLQEQGLEESKA